MENNFAQLQKDFVAASSRNYTIYKDDLTSMSYGEIEKTGHFIAFFKERSKYLDGTGTADSCDANVFRARECR